MFSRVGVALKDDDALMMTASGDPIMFPVPPSAGQNYFFTCKMSNPVCYLTVFPKYSLFPLKPPLLFQVAGVCAVWTERGIDLSW